MAVNYWLRPLVQPGPRGPARRRRRQLPTLQCRTRVRRAVSRPFKRQFGLAAHVRVEGAQFDNALLEVELIRVIPEAMKPRRIPIDILAASDVQQLEPRAA